MQITPQIIEEFRAYFGGRYSDTDVWSDDLCGISFARQISKLLGQDGVHTIPVFAIALKKHGMFLYAAAYISSFYGDDPSAPIDPIARLNVAGKSVGDESIQYRVASMMNAGDDFLTYTTFGQEFYRLRRRAYLGARAV